MTRSHKQPLGEVVRPDATIEAIQVDYEAVCLVVAKESGDRSKIRCEGHIGLRLVGFWDDVTIESGDIVEDHPFLVECEQRLPRTPAGSIPESGNAARNSGPYRVLRILLIDGCEILVCAVRFEVEPEVEAEAGAQRPERPF